MTVLILEPDTPGGLRASIAWRLVSRSATADDMVINTAELYTIELGGMRHSPRNYSLVMMDWTGGVRSSSVLSSARVSSREATLCGLAVALCV